MHAGPRATAAVVVEGPPEEGGREEGEGGEFNSAEEVPVRAARRQRGRSSAVGAPEEAAEGGR